MKNSERIEKIEKLLESKIDDIMLALMGSEIDENEDKYSKVYTHENRNAMYEFAYLYDGFLRGSVPINRDGLTYLLIQSFSSIIIFEYHNIDYDAISGIIKSIMKEMRH